MEGRHWETFLDSLGIGLVLGHLADPASRINVCGDPYKSEIRSYMSGVRFAVAGFDLSILAEADADQPGSATLPEALTLPSALHHPGYPANVGMLQSLESS